MKKITNFISSLVIISLTFFTSCGGSGGDENPPAPNPLEERAALLQGSWTGSASEVTYNNGQPDLDWGQFSLTISGASANGGSYSTSGTPEGFEVIWPTSGSWTFKDEDISTLTRNDGIEVTISTISETDLVLTFTIEDDGGRTTGIYGNWEFVYTAN